MTLLEGINDSFSRLFNSLKRTFPNFPQIMIGLLTLPYYRFYRINTIAPLVRLGKRKSQSANAEELAAILMRWRTEKLAELHFISIASAVLAAAVIGAFSWTIIADAYWLASAFWYSCLVLSIFDILLSAQQIGVLNALGSVSRDNKDDIAICTRFVERYMPLLLCKPVKHESRKGSKSSSWRPKRKMIFMWQCPIMFLSYAVLLFLVGLTLVVLTPFIRGDTWGPQSYIAVIYLALASLAATAFVFCSYWIHHLVDIDTLEPDLIGGSDFRIIPGHSIDIRGSMH